MQANGGIVEDVVALVDRHEGAEDKLKKMGVKLKRGDRDQRHRKLALVPDLIDENALESVLKQMVTQGE